MPVDLNELQRKLQQQRRVGVNRMGQLSSIDPKNDGTQSNANGLTTLEPKRFYS